MEITNYKTTKELLTSTSIPVPSRTYKPISHEQLIDLTLNSIYGSGFELDKEIYSSAKDGKVANAKYTISNVADKEMQLQIAWQNSYDKSLSLKFAIGTHVFICSNGMVSGDHGSFKKKHQGSIQSFTPNAITEYIKASGDVFKRTQEARETMKEIELSKRTKAELIGRMMFEEEFITSTQMNIIGRELNVPTYDYKAPNSLWELYNFTTYSLKESHPSNWMSSHIDAHNFFVNEAGALIPESKEIQVFGPGNRKQLEIFETI